MSHTARSFHAQHRHVEVLNPLCHPALICGLRREARVLRNPARFERLGVDAPHPAGVGRPERRLGAAGTVERGLPGGTPAVLVADAGTQVARGGALQAVSGLSVGTVGGGGVRAACAG